MAGMTPLGVKPGRYAINEGNFVIHQDQHGQSEGVADSDAMMSSDRIKVSFTSGPRKGECRWVPLQDVSVNQQAQDEKTLETLIIHARDDLKLAESKAAELYYFHTADDCNNLRTEIEKLIASRNS